MGKGHKLVMNVPKRFGGVCNIRWDFFIFLLNENENVIPKQLSQANLKFQLPYGEENLTKFPQLPSREGHLQLS
jgi:hypothetical protein